MPFGVPKENGTRSSGIERLPDGYFTAQKSQESQFGRSLV
jgi:hypothetical protein